MRWARVPAPFGPLAVAADDEGVCRVTFDGGTGPVLDPSGVPGGTLRRAVAQLAGYLAGDLTEFALPLSVRSGSDFERAVWLALRDIPYGEMRTYGEIAARVGDPGAARAVGVACNRNPLPVLVPCHRVVGADGKLVGFGGGLHRKRFLLELEARTRILRDFGT